MTIQIARGKSLLVYKINEYNHRQVLVRQNKHNARWNHYDTYATPEEARAALLKLERDMKGDTE